MTVDIEIGAVVFSMTFASGDYVTLRSAVDRAWELTVLREVSVEQISQNAHNTAAVVRKERVVYQQRVGVASLKVELDV